MRKLTIAQTTTAVFGTLIVGVLVVGGATWQRFDAERKALRWSDHTVAVLEVLQALNLTLHSAESGQRGYLLTGVDDYLPPYQDALQQVATLQIKLRRMVADNPIQQSLAQSLAPIVDHKLGALAAAVSARRDLGRDEALALMVSGGGQADMSRIVELIGSMTTVESTLLAQRAQDFSRRSGWVRGLVGAGVLLAVVMLLWAGRMRYRAATVDALTGLRSRNWMWEFYTAWRRRPKPPAAAMLLVDIDRFRSVNQVAGPTYGDAVLVEIGRRLTTAAGPHPVGRLGGDDFAIFCTGVTAREAEEIGAAVLGFLACPFVLQQHVLHLKASIGIAHSDAAREVDLRQGADDAQYVAKQQGGDQTVVFLPEMHDLRRQQAELEQGLHAAIAGDLELTLVYQPVVSLADHCLLAVEALARWNHPRLGPIAPDRFIELAEARGLIIPLGLKVMRMAVAQAAVWQARFPGRCPVININVSPIQLSAGGVIRDLMGLLKQHGLQSSGFCIEVTESAFTDARAVEALREARQLGFKVTMDDFGIGFSALSQLPRLPLVAIKLDRSFISHAFESPGDAAILVAIVQLARQLQLVVIAEGIELADQLRLVTDCGCDAVQGFYYSKPLPPEALEAWMVGKAPVAIPLAHAVHTG